MKQFTKFLVVVSFLSVNQTVLADSNNPLCQGTGKIAGEICKFVQGVDSVLKKYHVKQSDMYKLCDFAIKVATKQCSN